MSTPTDQQQIRATIRRIIRRANANGAQGAEIAAVAVLDEARELAGREAVERALAVVFADDPLMANDGQLPPLLGASEAADVLGMKATNLKRLSPPLPVAAVISGRIPVYRESDVLDAKRRRDARRAA